MHTASRVQDLMCLRGRFHLIASEIDRAMLQHFCSRFFILCCLSIPAYPALNAPNFGSGTGFNFGVWSGSGDMQITGAKKCVLSTDGADTSSGNPTNYRAKAFLTAGGSAFEVDDGSGNTIPFSIEYIDTQNGNDAETLSYNSYDSTFNLGGKKVGGLNCGNFGTGSARLNGRLRITFDEVDLLAAPNGSYSTLLSVRTRGGTGSETRTRNNIDIVIAKNITAVQVTRVSNLNLGAWNGVDASLSAGDKYCVYSTTGSYDISVSSTTTGAAPGSFAIENIAGDKIEYVVKVDDDKNASNGDAITNGGTISGYPASTVQPCADNDNGALFIETSGSLSAAKSGAYTGVLTILIEPH